MDNEFKSFQGIRTAQGEVPSSDFSCLLVSQVACAQNKLTSFSDEKVRKTNRMGWGATLARVPFPALAT
jgi:hypothetical protein